MDQSLLSYEAFEREVANHFEQLHDFYIRKVEESDDKLYAQEYYKKRLLEKNPLLPFGTVFFEQLTLVFDHHYRLKKSTALEQTFEQLTMIRNTSKAASDKLSIAIISNEFYPEDISECHLLLWEYGVNLETILEREQRICEMNEAGLIQKLAIYVAISKLRKRFDESEPIQRNVEKKGDYVHNFTQAQQVLFMNYLFRIAGIEPRYDADMTICTEIMHGIAGIPYNRIINSDLYKKLGKPLDNTSKKTTLQNLRFVRAYFERLNRPKILELIDRDIQELEEN